MLYFNARSNYLTIVVHFVATESYSLKPSLSDLSLHRHTFTRIFFSFSLYCSYFMFSSFSVASRGEARCFKNNFFYSFTFDNNNFKNLVSIVLLKSFIHFFSLIEQNCFRCQIAWLADHFGFGTSFLTFFLCFVLALARQCLPLTKAYRG